LVQGEVAQLFADMAITITAAAVLSMFASLTLVPDAFWVVSQPGRGTADVTGGDYSDRNWFEKAIARTSAAFRRLQSKLERFLLATVGWSLGPRRFKRRLALLSIPVVLLIASIFLLPPADYLPEGNRNLILWLTEPFPGTSVAEAVELSAPARNFLKQQPEIENTFFVNFPQFRAIGITLKPEAATSNGLAGMVERLTGKSFGYPGYRFMFPIRRSIFNDPGKEFEVQLIGPNLEQLAELEQQVTQQIRGLPGVVNVRSDFVSGAPELQVIPNRERLAEVGLSEAELGQMVEAALGGRFASEFVDGKEELDVTVQLQNVFVETPEQLRQLSLYSRGQQSAAATNTQGQQVQLADVAEVRETTGPDVINHVDLERSTTLTVSLAPAATVGTASRAG
jgi:HAE1 family hydrophobic/amphiphilic exporter-1